MPLLKVVNDLRIKNYAQASRVSSITISVIKQIFCCETISQDRLWWPSGLSRRSNSIRVAAGDPGWNPTQGMDKFIWWQLHPL